MKIPKEVIKELVREEKFTSTTDILDSIKGIFKEVLEECIS